MNQIIAIEDVIEILNDNSSIFVVIMDFKMKLEKMKHRENIVNNFGKRGLLWHGTLVLYSV